MARAVRGFLIGAGLAQASIAPPPAEHEKTGTGLLGVDGRHVGEVLSIPESRLAHGQWPGVQASRADPEELSLRDSPGLGARRVGPAAVGALAVPRRLAR